MSYDNSKPWIKITIPIIILLIGVLIGVLIGYFIFNVKIEPNPTIEYLEEDNKRITSRYDSILKLNKQKDSISEAKIIEEELIIKEINENVNKNRNNPSQFLYDSLVRTNAEKSRRLYPR